MALALFDLDETLIAGDSASLWLEHMVAQELAPAAMVAEEQAMMSLYHQGKMDMHQYMAFTLQPLAGKTRQELDALAVARDIPLFTLLACDTLVNYRLKWVKSAAAGGKK